MKLKTISLLLVCSFNFIPAQQKDSLLSEVNYFKLAAIAGITTAGFIYGHILQQDLWWKGEKSRFHFEWKNDWKYALGADKFGHFYFPYLVSSVYSEAFHWTGIKEEQSLLFAASLAFTYQTYVEVRDGFSKKWGFSWGDFAANTIGAAYPFLQYKISPLKNFNWKISYYPSERFRNNSHNTLIDDYESTYSWLSVNVNNLLPDNIKKYYPAFINLALGHSVKNLDSPGKEFHEIFLSLDWNIEALPGESTFMRKLKKFLNFYHFPAPAVRIAPDVIWYGLKF